MRFAPAAPDDLWVHSLHSIRRILVIALLTLSAWLALATPASAKLETEIVGDASLQPLADSFLVPDPPGRVRVIVAPCPSEPGAQGCHSSGSTMDTIWLDPESGGLDAETFAHEMGHVFESYMWNLYWRHHARFVPRLFHRIVPLLGLEPVPGALKSTAWTERFAEAYSLCARESTLSAPISNGYWGFAATPETHVATCGLIDSLGERYERARARVAHR
jgi:hypothetical protein